MKHELDGRIIRVVKAEILEGHTVAITFDDGKVTVIDFKPFLLAHPHECSDYLLDEEEFAKNMEIVYGDLVWGENYDLSFPRGNYYFGDLEGDYE